MSNSFISVKQIARETLPRLIDNLVFPNLIYRDTAGAGAAKKGDTVAVRRPVKLTAREFSENDGVTAEGITEECVNVKLDKIATVDAEVSALESALSFDSVTRLFIEPAAAALAEKINNDGLSLYADVPYVAGTAGTTPDALADFSAAALALDNNRVPTSKRCAVWDPTASAAFKQIPALVNAEKCGTTTALRSGSIGEVFGISNYMTQAVKSHTAGTLAPASGNMTLSEAASASNSVKITGTTLTGTLKKGDILTVGGKTCTVTEDAAVADGTITAKVYPAITASSGATVTLTGSHKANLVFHPDAFAFVTRPLSTPAGVESYVTTYNGISLRVVRGYDMKYKREMLSMDVLYSFATLYPELACRYLG
ncbi:MAG: P22 coat protein [Clostridia bacterium]|nr:P22 coat protein [Clostridia bacterium]